MLEQAVIIALIVYFLKATFWKGMIFERVGKWIEAKIGKKWSKPITGCPVCMVPYWGAIFYNAGHYIGLAEFDNNGFFHVVYVLFSAAGINTVILMLNKEYDVAIKEDKILKKEMKIKNIK